MTGMGIFWSLIISCKEMSLNTRIVLIPGWVFTLAVVLMVIVLSIGKSMMPLHDVWFTAFSQLLAVVVMSLVLTWFRAIVLHYENSGVMRMLAIATGYLCLSLGLIVLIDILNMTWVATGGEMFKVVDVVPRLGTEPGMSIMVISLLLTAVSPIWLIFHTVLVAYRFVYRRSAFRLLKSTVGVLFIGIGWLIFSADIRRTLQSTQDTMLTDELIEP